MRDRVPAPGTASATRAYRTRRARFHPVPQKESVMANADDLKRTIDRLNGELSRIESVPDPALMPVETVLFWQHTYPLGLNRHREVGRYSRSVALGGTEPTAYKFISIKVLYGTWYTTAQDSDVHVMNDDELRGWLADPNVNERYIVSEWLKLDEYVPTSPFEGPGE